MLELLGHIRDGTRGSWNPGSADGLCEDVPSMVVWEPGSGLNLDLGRCA